MINSEDTNRFFHMLEENIPFSLARFNDGEMMGVKATGSVVARGDQVVNDSLRNKLIEAIQHRQENYWIGKPCSTCFPKHYDLYRTYVPEYNYETYAVQFCNNGNWDKVINKLQNIFQERSVYWVSGHDQDIKKLGFYSSIKKHIMHSNRNGWIDYERVRKLSPIFEDGCVVIISSGPMSRVLAYEWFKENPNCTFLDVGSLFDPFTRNVWHNCHKGKLNFCKECNWNS